MFPRVPECFQGSSRVVSLSCCFKTNHNCSEVSGRFRRDFFGINVVFNVLPSKLLEVFSGISRRFWCLKVNFGSFQGNLK